MPRQIALLVTFAVAFGFAGGKHLPTNAFAFVLGCAVVANLLACHYLPGVRGLTVSWISLLAAYVAATVAAVLKEMG